MMQGSYDMRFAPSPSFVIATAFSAILLQGAANSVFNNFL